MGQNMLKHHDVVVVVVVVVVLVFVAATAVAGSISVHINHGCTNFLKI